MTKHPAFLSAVVVTLCWLGFVFWWLVNSPLQNPDDCNLLRFLCPIRQMELNAAGDFMAGTFSVLAFLWLATAVLLQGSELERQREEFKAGRLETTKQTNMLEKSAELQHQLLEDERLIQSTRELLDELYEFWPEKFTVFSATGERQEVKIIRPSGDLASHENVESALNMFSRGLLASIKPITEFELHIDETSTDENFLSEIRMVQMRAQYVLEKQKTVSPRYLTSRIFSNASTIMSVCELFMKRFQKPSKTH